MNKTLLVVALMLSGCGGTSPELYDLVVSFFTLPDSCYSNGMQPSSGVTAAPPRVLQVQVWDGPDNVPFLEVQGAGFQIDMGAAPNVAISGVFIGKKADKGFTFTSEMTDKSTVIGNTVTDTTKAELTFERIPQFKGTGSLTSARTCTGSNCGNGASPTCSVSGITFSGTKLNVNYERAP